MSNTDMAIGIISIEKLKAKEDILYRLARLARNTDGLHPSTSGPMIGRLLSALRILDNKRYDQEVMIKSNDLMYNAAKLILAVNNPDVSIHELVERAHACGYNIEFTVKET